MKSKFKKLLAAALVLCLVLALLPAAAFAEGENNGTDASGAETSLDPTSQNGDPQGSDPLGGDTYTIKVQNNNGQVPANGTVSIKVGTGEFVEYSGSPISATTGVIVTVKAEGKSEDYALAEISADSVGLTQSGDCFTFNMPGSNVTLTTVFQKYYSLTVSSDIKNGRLICPQKAIGTSLVTITALPEDGYQLSRLWVEGTSQDLTLNATVDGNTATFKMPNDNVIVKAEFKQEPVLPPVTKYWVATSVFGDGGSIIQDNRLYAKGETVTLSVTADKGYELDQLFYYNADSHVTTNPVSIDKTTKSFVMPDYDVKVIATFKPIEDYEYDINVDVSGNCQVSQPETAAPGELVKISVDVNSGYHLLYVKVDGDYVTDSVYWADGKWNYSFYMPWHDVYIYVATTDKLFVNTVYDINGGAVELWVKDEVSGWDSTIFADADDWVCFKATPYSGYDVGSVSVTGRWSGKAYDAYYNRYDGYYYFKMPYESVNLSVSFIDNSHKVTVKDVTNGSLSVNTKWAVEDERVYITAVPDKGYELTWLYVKAADGTSVKVYDAIKEDTYYFFMPDQEVTVSAIFAYDYPDMPFIDVNPNSWYYSAIEFVYNKGIMNGVTASSFNPDGTITRGMIVTMLWRMAGEPSAVAAGFADVAADSYYAKAIAWAANNGIIEGYSASSFGPNDAITREQLATVLYRYAKYLGYTTTGSSLSGYYDASRVSSWAKDAMGWAVKNGVVTGLSSTWLNPNGTASRAEAAQMFMNFYEFLG